MTIALGILAGPTMILASDTEISVGDDKYIERKIHTMSHSDSTGKRGKIAITGAGDTDYLKSIYQELSDEFMAHQSANADEVEGQIRKIVKGFYKEHIVPFHDDPDGTPSMWLVVAACRDLCPEREHSGKWSRMWVTSRNKVRRVDDFAAVGIGRTYAETLLGRLRMPQKTETAMALAAYIIFLVKDRVRGCGKETEVVTLENKWLLSRLSAEKCRELEEVFRGYLSVEARLLHRVIGSDHGFAESAGINFEVEGLRERILEIIPREKPDSLSTKGDPSPQPPSLEPPGGSGES
jgi:hypothetical protein